MAGNQSNWISKIAILSSSISLLVAMQNQLDLGPSFEIFANHYKIIRNFFLQPFSWIDIDLTERAKDTITIVFLVSMAFAFRGGKWNKTLLVGFVGSLFLFIVGAMMFGIGGLIDNRDLIAKRMDEDGFESLTFLESVRGVIIFPLFLIGSLLCLQLSYWVIAILFPFFYPIVAKIPYVGFFLVYPILMLTIGIFKMMEKYFPKIIRGTFLEEEENDEIALRVIGKFLTLKEYKVYYQPLVPLVYLSIPVIFLFKVIFDTFIG